MVITQFNTITIQVKWICYNYGYNNKLMLYLRRRWPALGGLTDVDTTSATAGQVLKYDGNSPADDATTVAVELTQIH